MKTAEEILAELYEPNEEYSLQLCITLNPSKSLILDAMETYANQQTSDLTTQLAKANSDKEKLGEYVKVILDELTEVIEFNRNGNCEEILLLQLAEAKKIKSLLTDCGITL
jgi:hypothetical protein